LAGQKSLSDLGSRPKLKASPWRVADRAKNVVKNKIQPELDQAKAQLHPKPALPLKNQRLPKTEGDGPEGTPPFVDLAEKVPAGCGLL